MILLQEARNVAFVDSALLIEEILSSSDRMTNKSFRESNYNLAI